MGEGETVKPIAAVLFALLSLIWGSSYLFIKVAVAGVTPLTLVEGRLAGGAAVLLLLVWLLGLRLPRDRSTWFHLAVMAVFGNILPFLLISWAEQHVDSSLAAILNATTPFFTLILAVAALHVERWTANNLAGLVVGFAGVAVLTGANLSDLGSASAHGTLALLASSLCYGISFAYARRFVRGNPQVLAAAQLLVATLLLAPVAFRFGDVGATDLNAARLGSWLALTVLGTGLAYIIYYRLIDAIGATRSSYTTYVIPVVGVLWGWLLLEETVGLNTIAGVILILGGLLIANRPRWPFGRHATHEPSATAPTEVGGR